MTQISTITGVQGTRPGRVGVPDTRLQLPQGGGIGQGIASAAQSVAGGLDQYGRAMQVVENTRQQNLIQSTKNQVAPDIEQIILDASMMQGAEAVGAFEVAFDARVEQVFEQLGDADSQVVEQLEMEFEAAKAAGMVRVRRAGFKNVQDSARTNLDEASNQFVSTFSRVMPPDMRLQALDRYAMTVNGYVASGYLTEAEGQQRIQRNSARAVVEQYNAYLNDGDPEGALNWIESAGTENGVAAEVVTNLITQAGKMIEQQETVAFQNGLGKASEWMLLNAGDQSMSTDEFKQGIDQWRRGVAPVMDSTDEKLFDEAVDNAAMDIIESAAQQGNTLLFNRGKEVLSSSVENDAFLAKQTAEYEANLKKQTEVERVSAIKVASFMSGNGLDIQADSATNDAVYRDLMKRGKPQAEILSAFAASPQGVPAAAVADLNNMSTPGEGEFNLPQFVESLEAVANGGGENRARQLARSMKNKDLATTAYDMARGKQGREREMILGVLSNERAGSAIEIANLNIAGDESLGIDPVEASSEIGADSIPASVRSNFNSAVRFEYARAASLNQDFDAADTAVRNRAIGKAVEEVQSRYTDPISNMNMAAEIAITALPFGFLMVDERVPPAMIEKRLITGDGRDPTDGQRQRFTAGMRELSEMGAPVTDAVFKVGSDTFVPALDGNGNANAFMQWNPRRSEFEIVSDSATVESLSGYMLGAVPRVDRLPDARLRYREEYGSKSALEVDKSIVLGFKQRAESTFRNTKGYAPDPNSVADRQEVRRIMEGQARNMGWPSLAPQGEQ